MGFNVINFVKHDIWLLNDQSLPFFQASFVKLIKIVILSTQSFSRDLCPLRASALTLYSLLSIVPVIAMLFGVAKGFGFEKILEQWLIEQAPKQDTLMFQLISFARNQLDSTKGEVVAGIGVVVLFWTIISVISNIEESFNYIWKIGKGRSIKRKFSDYLSLMLLAPVILIASSSITVFLKAKITWLVTFIHLPTYGTWLVIQALSLSPFMLLIGLFSFMFIFIPNNKVDLWAGIIAGMVTGILYNLLQWAYLSLQIGVSSYNAIYGSFAALPLFVVWLQIGWMTVLMGCEVAFFLQNYEIYSTHNQYSHLSPSLKKVIALQITHLIIKNFSQLNKASTAAELASKLGIPDTITRATLLKLVASQIVVEFNNQDEVEAYYQPAVSINIMTIAYVINALEHTGKNELPVIQQEQLSENPRLDFRELMTTSKQNCLLKDM
jgi:membrane protein